jgi:hypothetical protein
MPHSFNQAALAIIINGMKGGTDSRLADLKRKLENPHQSGSVALDYAITGFDIIPLVENAIVDLLRMANPDIPNVQVHITSSTVRVCADKDFVDFVLRDLFSQLYYAIKQGTLVSVYVAATEEAGVVEIQETGISQLEELLSNNALISTHESLIVCRQLLEDMGGEMLYLLNDKGNYFRLKYILG